MNGFDVPFNDMNLNLVALKLIAHILKLLLLQILDLLGNGSEECHSSLLHEGSKGLSSVILSSIGLKVLLDCGIYYQINFNSLSIILSDGEQHT